MVPILVIPALLLSGLSIWPDDSAPGLLHRPDVQAELKVTAKQLQRWEELDPFHNAKSHGTFQPDVLVIPDPDELEKKNETREKKLWSVLKPEQMSRLLELTVQRQGVRVLLRKDVRDGLDMRTDQVDAVLRAKSKHDMDIRAVIKKVQTARTDQKRVVDSLKAIEQRLVDELTVVPTPDQNRLLEERGGKPFRFLDNPGG